jgi:hypothetical protein
MFSKASARVQTEQVTRVVSDVGKVMKCNGERQRSPLSTRGKEGVRPQTFRQACWGCGIAFRFPMVKLLDYVTPERWGELEAGDKALEAAFRQEPPAS